MAVLDNGNGRRHGQLADGEAAARQVLRRRATYLPPAEQALLNMALEGVASRRQMGALMGIPAGTVTRRVRRLAMRLYDPLVVALLEHPGGLRPEYRQLGIEFFLQRRSAEELADLHRLSIVEVRRMIEFIRGWFRGRSERR